ncbi:ComEC/Rec2 family competence protein [Chryseobacterium camelliae]|uniref:ComEC/Rec2 family competence protein n=1 Tax=Chryseobacterium camelliae TaxID=1265445 RepID=A0ABY7QT11_9FLAO|nr:ComEC/Rec2 family competence protein [Chryseobacterium camelliae]WBV61901.1 ComEC/Rec2 family competence protein [Chryseobacterium camelliae]
MSKIKPLLLMLSFFGIGIGFHYFQNINDTKTAFRKEDSIVFKISKKLNSTDKYKKYEVLVQSGENYENALIYLPKDSKELNFENYYQSKAFLYDVKEPQYDFQFNYAKYLHRKKIQSQFYLHGDILSKPRSDLILTEKIQQKRWEVLQKINQSNLSSKSQEFLKGIILADRTEIDAESLQDFNTSGLVHFLAISGTHIAVIFGLFYMLLIKILPVQLRKYAIVSSLLFIWMFAVFIGLGNSVVRSCIMLTVYFVYILFQRKPDLLHSLALSAFVILIFDSEQLFDIGFQLSFIAVLGIFWLNQPILHYLPKADTYFKKLMFNTVSISISAQLSTLPLVLFYFHQFSFISILANFFIVPFSETIIVFSFLMTVLISFNLDVSFINIIYDFTVHILLKTIHWFGSVDVLFTENIAMNLVEVIGLFGGLYLLRFVILKCNTQNAARLIMGVLMFLIVRTGFNIYEGYKDEVLIHSFYRHKVLSVKKGERVCFWIDEKSDKQKVMRFIVNPYCASRRLRFATIKTLPNTAQKMMYENRIYEME